MATSLTDMEPIQQKHVWIGSIWFNRNSQKMRDPRVSKRVLKTRMVAAFGWMSGYVGRRCHSPSNERSLRMRRRLRGLFLLSVRSQSGRWPCSGGRSLSEALLARANY
jgi:hypothetical protein